jgi:hypothetical protein
MKRSKIAKYGVWLLPFFIGAAAMVGFLLIRDAGETLAPPAAVGEQGLPGTPVALEKMQEARDFDGWPLWWLGDSFDSLSLTHVDELTPARGFPTMNFVSFVYGTCAIAAGRQSCAPPLEIQVDPLCSVPPEKIAGVERDDPFDFRGAKALWIDDHLRIWTGDSAIAIFGYPRDRVEAAAEALVPLGNVEVTLSGSNLPPPNFESCPETPVYPLPAIVTPTQTP